MAVDRHGSDIMFDHRTPLVHIDGSLTADRYITQVVEPCSALVAWRTQHGIPARQCQGACRTANS